MRDARGATLKDAVNEALRRGLKRMTEPAPESPRRRTEVVSLGRCLIGDLDNVTKPLAVAESEAFR